VKIGDVTICWTPDGPQYPAGFRGKVRCFPAGTPEADLELFACRAGRVDTLAHDPSLEKRQAYALKLALFMTQRDGLNLAAVHQLMLAIDEYRSGCAPELLSEAACPDS
jgi:hypothetical protein